MSKQTNAKINEFLRGNRNGPVQPASGEAGSEPPAAAVTHTEPHKRFSDAIRAAARRGTFTTKLTETEEPQ